MATTKVPPPVENNSNTSIIITAVVIPVIGVAALAIGLAYKRHLGRQPHHENHRQKPIKEAPNVDPVQNGREVEVQNANEIRHEEIGEATTPSQSINNRNIELPARPVDAEEYVEMRIENDDGRSQGSGHYDTISVEFCEYENRKLRGQEQNNREGVYSIDSLDHYSSNLTINPEDWAAPHDPDNLPEIIE